MTSGTNPIPRGSRRVGESGRLPESSRDGTNPISGAGSRRGLLTERTQFREETGAMRGDLEMVLVGVILVNRSLVGDCVNCGRGPRMGRRPCSRRNEPNFRAGRHRSGLRMELSSPWRWPGGTRLMLDPSYSNCPIQPLVGPRTGW
jgi:hypothetical protein